MISIDQFSIKHSFFKENISWLYFQLSRKNEHKHIEMIRIVFLDLLQNLKRDIRDSKNSQWLQYLEVLFRLIGFSRDTYVGLGEQTISYMLLTTLYDVFPALSIFAIHQFVKLNDSSSPRTIGSWRDIKHICYYLKENSAQQENHSLIPICIEVANTQLKKDTNTWKFSTHCFSKLHISNVAKHIPRENSSPKFSWLFHLFAIHWTQHSYSYIFQNIDKPSSNIKALTKSKCIFRKQLTFLNKALLTFQRTNTIDDLPNIQAITPHTIMRQPSLFFNGEQELSTQLLENSTFISDESTIIQRDTFRPYTNGYSHSTIPVYHIIKEAFRIVSNESRDLSDKYISFINIQWKHILLSFSRHQADHSFLPLVDVSDSTDSISFYSSIGYAMIVASISKFSNRFIAIDTKPTWVSFDSNDSLTEQILHIKNTISSMQNGTSDFKRGVELVAQTLTQVNSSIAFCNDMKLVLFSHFQNNIDSSQLQYIFQSYGLLSHPTFVFWNMSLDKIIDLPCAHSNSNCLLLSGHAMSNVHYLIHFSNKKLSVYDSIVDRLLHPRYKGFSDYLHRIVATF